MEMNEVKAEKTIITATRIYWVSQSEEIWQARFQPLNPKTGKPWQASRRIKVGHDCWRAGNWKLRTQTAMQSGPLPKFEVWTQFEGGQTGADSGFSSEELAWAAVEREQLKSGK
jgi:hypothetical protein